MEINFIEEDHSGEGMSTPETIAERVNSMSEDEDFVIFMSLWGENYGKSEEL